MATLLLVPWPFSKIPDKTVTFAEHSARADVIVLLFITGPSINDRRWCHFGRRNWISRRGKRETDRYSSILRSSFMETKFLVCVPSVVGHYGLEVLRSERPSLVTVADERPVDKMSMTRSGRIGNSSVVVRERLKNEFSAFSLNPNNGKHAPRGGCPERMKQNPCRRLCLTARIRGHVRFFVCFPSSKNVSSLVKHLQIPTRKSNDFPMLKPKNFIWTAFLSANKALAEMHGRWR